MSATSVICAPVAGLAPRRREMNSDDGRIFMPTEVVVPRPRSDAPLRIPLVPARLQFENICLGEFCVVSDEIAADARVVAGEVAATALKFRAEWNVAADGWVRFAIQIFGEPDAAWGKFQRLMLLDEEMPTAELRADLGWRELGGTAEEALMERPPEEGGGLQPPFGFPIFGPDFFIGAEHPMACIEADGSRVRVFHHPLWANGKLCSIPLVLGVCGVAESTAEAFGRYFMSIRRPAPERAIVEINTFWTDSYDEVNGYRTDIESYRVMAEHWAKEVLRGEKGLVSHFLLDAGWQEPDSIFRPQASNGGPNDAALAELGRDLEALGISLGLWFTVNGPIGIGMDWAKAQGYRVFNRGTGAGYTCNQGRTRYLCLTDARWEEDLCRRLEELIGNVPVTFFKGDWDNDAIEDPTRGDIGSALQLREAIADAMIRIYGRMHAARPGVALRGAWWLSPWWFPHVDNTHLPNSGDHESLDIPSLTQRDSGITCRDAVVHHVMVRSASPVAWDVVCPHEFANSRRNPVQDSEDSWMNNLAMWISRGTHYLQMYLAPYGMDDARAWSIREILRWFRADEELHWKNGTTMLGGDPLGGHVYAYHHQAGGRHLLTIRNPLAHPQALPDLANWGLTADGWEQVFPICRAFSAAGYFMASHEVLMLARGGESVGDRVLVNTVQGWREPWPGQGVPDLHDLGEPSAHLERRSANELAIHAVLPYGLASAEVVLSIRAPREARWRAAVGRYPNGTATFGVPLVHVRPHWQSGYTQGRLKAPSYDPTLGVLRFPIGTGGRVHGFLRGEDGLPEVLGAWIEAREALCSAENVPSVLRPPAMSHPVKCLLQIARK